ncbi:MAG: hypothetical protein RL701_3708, partial [Pseudomonadota bacterium]
LILHVNDSAHGSEYTFPCRVVARVVKAPASMGVRFEGMPSQTRVGRQSGAVWRADVLSTDVRGRDAANGGDPA